MTQDHDLVVIGGGAGGLAAAREAARRKAGVLLVHEGPLGGDCTWTGCVPSKALIAAAARGESFDDALHTVHVAREEIAKTEDAAALAREGIDTLRTRATFVAPGKLDVDGRRLHPERIVLATGAGPAFPPIEGLDRVPTLTNETVFELDRRPDGLLVLGGGAVGCELAQAFRRLGSKVTVVEALERLLAREEPEASEVVERVFAREGIEVVTGTRVERAEPVGGGARLHLADGRTFDGDQVLVATGRRPSTDGFGLDVAGVDLEGGYIKTDDELRTTSPGVFAAGDCTGKLPFTHAADQMGRIASANALTRPWRKLRLRTVPWCTFTAPEVARVGLGEAEAADRGARVAFVPMSEVDRAVASRATDGFVKLIAGPRPVLRGVAGGQLLGATIVAPPAGEMIHEVVLAMRARMLTGRLAQTVHAYPTWSMAVRQAAGQFFREVGGRTARPARTGA